MVLMNDDDKDDGDDSDSNLDDDGDYLDLTLLFQINEELAHSVLSESLLDCPGISIKFPLPHFFQQEQL